MMLSSVWDVTKFFRDCVVSGLLPTILLAGFLLAFPMPAQAGNPVDVGALVSVQTPPGRCTLDRRTRLYTCTADITLNNISQQKILAPLHLVFLIQGTEVQMPDARGGPGSDPYRSYYYDLSSSLTSADLTPGKSLVVKATFITTALTPNPPPRRHYA